MRAVLGVAQCFNAIKANPNLAQLNRCLVELVYVLQIKTVKVPLAIGGA